LEDFYRLFSFRRR